MKDTMKLLRKRHTPQMANWKETRVKKKKPKGDKRHEKQPEGDTRHEINL